MIKRIPIKGISRDPSGQIAADGMCADSLNVQLDMGEIAPAISPKEANSRFEKETDGAVLPADKVSGMPKYIHKGEGYENLLCVTITTATHHGVETDIYRLISYSKDFGSQGVITSYNVSINEVVAVGNTLIVSKADSLIYVLWKDGEYKVLGDKIPIPDVSFRIGDLEDLDRSAKFQIMPVPGTSRFIPAETPDIPKEDGQLIPWNGTDFACWWACHAESFSGNNYTVFRDRDMHMVDSEDSVLAGDWGGRSVEFKAQNDTQQAIIECVSDTINKKVKQSLNDGKCHYPFFIRYAVRLYDGSLYAASIPVLLAADIEDFYQIRCMTIGMYSDEECKDLIRTYYAVATEEAVPFAPFIKFNDSSTLFQEWGDIISGVDIFVSPQLIPDINKEKVTLMDRCAGEGGGTYIYGVLIKSQLVQTLKFDADPIDVRENQEDWVTQFQDTYLIKSYTAKEFANLAGVEVRLDDVNFSNDYITNQEVLKETPGSMHTIIGGNLYKYNNRLLVSAPSQKLFPGYNYFHSSIWKDTSNLPSYYVYFFIHGDNGDYIVSRYLSPRGEAVMYNSEYEYEEAFGPWIAYPDSRCYKVMFVRSTLSGYSSISYPMKALSQIDVSYAFIGFGNEVATIRDTTSDPSPDVNDVWLHSDSLFVADVNNPFLFTTDKILRFSNGNILAVGAITVPLSEGQKGQFPLYVFTDEGVFALSVNEVGEFMSTDAVSRDVILSKNALTAIEQGIFFASARGLLLLQGNAITKVSDLMDGPVDEMDSTLQQTIGSLYFVDFDIPSADTFADYLQGCRMAYDYVAKRIIVFNPTKDYAYIYKMDTQSWHRFCFGPNLTNALNSYPEALISTKEPDAGVNVQVVYDFSVPAESEGAVALPGLVYSRELLLDGADVYKAISHLKVRGRYQDGHVKWQLQGSNDGVNYVNLHSLRGPSWKWYRIAVVTLLDPTERVSYIELDYNPKFTNKIR